MDKVRFFAKITQYFSGEEIFPHSEKIFVSIALSGLTLLSQVTKEPARIISCNDE